MVARASQGKTEGGSPSLLILGSRWALAEMLTLGSRKKHDVRTDVLELLEIRNKGPVLDAAAPGEGPEVAL